MVGSESVFVFSFETAAKQTQLFAKVGAFGFGKEFLGVERNYTFHVQQVAEFDVFPDVVADEEQFGLAVVDDMGDVDRVEVRQNRDYSSTVSDGRHESSDPDCTIFATKSHLVALLDAKRLKQHVGQSNLFGEVAVGQGLLCWILCQTREIPILTKTVFVKFYKILFNHNRLILERLIIVGFVKTEHDAQSVVLETSGGDAETTDLRSLFDMSADA